jgi:hypothetical protein
LAKPVLEISLAYIHRGAPNMNTWHGHNPSFLLHRRSAKETTSLIRGKGAPATRYVFRNDGKRPHGHIQHMKYEMSVARERSRSWRWSLISCTASGSGRLHIGPDPHLAQTIPQNKDKHHHNHILPSKHACMPKNHTWLY